MSNHVSRLVFTGKRNGSSKKIGMNIIALTIISLLVFAPQMIFVVSPTSEPSMQTILEKSGFTNIELTNIETFPAGIYNITLLAEFGSNYNDNVLSYYIVETTDYQTIFTGPEGANRCGGFVNPLLSRMFEIEYAFGLSLTTPQHQYFTEHDLNPDFEIHCQIYKNLDNPKMLFIGFENCYGESIDRDYNDMVFSLTLMNPVKILNVSRNPEIPNYDESVLITSIIKTGLCELDSVVLGFNVKSSSWTNVTMTFDTTEYVGTIPAQSYGEIVTYKIYAVDRYGNSESSEVFSYVVGDFVEPEIVNVTQIPLTVTSGQFVKIFANITEPVSASGVKKVNLWYKTNGNWVTNGMGIEDGLWTANIPGQKQGTPVQYYIEVFDNAGNMAESSPLGYTVIISNNMPIADFSVVPSSGYTEENFKFDGSASSDLDGYIVNYFWDFGDESYAYGETVIHAYAESGEYSVSLRVRDNRGGTGTTTKTVTVENSPPSEEPNNAPVAFFIESPEHAYATETVAFDASGSSDSDGQIISYNWDFGDGTSATGVTATHVYGDDGPYLVELTVSDNEGATDSTSITKDILNNSPSASFTQASDEVIVDEENSFDASESFDIDGIIIEYLWDFGDGTTATGINVVNTYPNSGPYTVTLTVTDDDGAVGSVASTVNVVNQAPVAIFTANTTSITENQGIQFDATESYDPDGTIANYSWDFGDGTTSTGLNANHNYIEEGDYTVTLIVTDDEGFTDSTTMDVTVTAEPEVSLAVLSVIGLGITALTATLLYGIFVRRNKKKKFQ